MPWEPECNNPPYVCDTEGIGYRNDHCLDCKNGRDGYPGVLEMHQRFTDKLKKLRAKGIQEEHLERFERKLEDGTADSFDETEKGPWNRSYEIICETYDWCEQEAQCLLKEKNEGIKASQSSIQTQNTTTQDVPCDTKEKGKEKRNKAM